MHAYVHEFSLLFVDRGGAPCLLLSLLPYFHKAVSCLLGGVYGKDSYWLSDCSHAWPILTNSVLAFKLLL